MGKFTNDRRQRKTLSGKRKDLLMVVCRNGVDLVNTENRGGKKIAD